MQFHWLMLMPVVMVCAVVTGASLLFHNRTHTHTHTRKKTLWMAAFLSLDKECIGFVVRKKLQQENLVYGDSSEHTIPIPQKMDFPNHLLEEPYHPDFTGIVSSRDF